MSSKTFFCDYSVVTIYNDEIIVKDVKSEFTNPTPEELNLPDYVYNVSLVPWNEDFLI